MAYKQNKNLMQEFGPKWSQEEFAGLKKSNQIDYNFASSVSETGKPIPPPSSDLGHGFLFPRHAYLIDFTK
ncbi:hypothetical protein VP01_2378g6 [Puccinia sorghi]|uniref:Uncharacterized protein n=1 Tax=Puccinia sorghi TaxID=27349 RepID=A0A0L6V8W1_9BASI|nr:hypothetical protein VP01_2378g6 [Puccinia sorghi]